MALQKFSLTVTAADVAASASNFPAYVNLALMPAEFWNTVTNGGGDIRCYSDSGLTTQLAREVVVCLTASDTGEIWVKIASLTTSTVIYITCDGTSTEPSAGSTYGSQAVWTDYAMVLHLQAGVSDSTVNAHTQTSSSGVTTGVAASIQNGNEYSGSSSYSYIGGTFPSGTSARTITALVKSDTTSGSRFAYSYGNDATRQMMGFYSNNTPRWYVTFNSQDADTGISISTSAYQKLTLTYNGTGSLGFVDGVQRTSMTFTANTGSGNFTIGNYPAQTGVPLDGTIDELRVRTDAVDGNWESTENNNWTDNAGFWTVAYIPSASSFPELRLAFL